MIAKRKSKYHIPDMFRLLRKAAKFRDEMNAEGFSDNFGAIHSVERILDMLSYRIKYPGLTHIRKIRDYNGAEFSKRALDDYLRGEKVFIEHVAPQRAFATKIIDLERRIVDVNRRGFTNQFEDDSRFAEDFGHVASFVEKRA